MPTTTCILKYHQINDLSPTCSRWSPICVQSIMLSNMMLINDSCFVASYICQKTKYPDVTYINPISTSVHDGVT